MTRLMAPFKIMVLCLSLSVAAIASDSFAQTQTELTPQQMRVFAADAVIKKDPRLGYQVASALLTRDPNDTEALIIRARAARDLGRYPEAIATARRAWQLAATPSERFGASMVMAQALSTSGSKTRAQIWLRRAAQNAPSDEFKNVAVRDFRYVRSTNPWSTELSISASPNSNINNGSARSSTRLFDLPFEFQLTGAAQALSGMEYSAGIATRYRLAESQRAQNDLVFQLSHRTYTMSDDAKRLSPTSKGTDFAFSTASLSYIRRGFSGPGTDLPHQFELTGGRTWYGHAPFMQYLRFGFTQNVVTGPNSLVFAGLAREYQQSLSARQDVDSWTVNTGFRLALENKSRLTLSLTAKKSNSISTNLNYQQITLGARYALGQPIAGVSVDFGLSISHKDHEISRFSRFGRLDKTVSLDVTGVFNRLEYYGFVPAVTLSAQQTRSNIGLFDSDSLGVRLGLQSSF